MMQYLLHVPERHSAKHCQSTIQPDALRQHQRPRRRRWDDKRRKAGECDDGEAAEKGSAEVQVFLLLGGGADEGDAAHHANSVEAGAGEEGRVEEEEWREESGLCDVEGGPESVFRYVASQVVSTRFIDS